MSNRNKLNLIGWSGYPLLGDVFQAFQRATGIGIRFIGYRNQDEMLDAVNTQVDSDDPFDIASPTTDRLVSWNKAGIIQPWDEEKINFSNIAPQYQVDQHTLIDGKRMGAPNLWGSAGICHHQQKAPLNRKSTYLIDLFDNVYAGKLAMREDTAMVAAGRALELQNALPHPFSDSYAEESKMVENYDVILDFLLSKKKNISHFWFSEEEGQAAFTSGDCTIGYNWDTTALALQKQGYPIRYIAPVEGANSYLQNFVLLKSARHVAEANTWVSWVNSAEGGAMYANAFGAFSPTQGAEALMSDVDRAFFELAYPESARDMLWWQPEQKPWFVKKRQDYAQAFMCAW